MKLIWIPFCFILAGCWHQRGSISLPNATVTGVKDAGKPASLASEQKGESLPLPAGSKVTVTEFAATLDLPAHDGLSAQRGQPARKVTEVVLSAPSEWKREESTVKADTGTVDTSVRKHEQDLAASQPLLWAALLCGAGAIFFLYKAYPTPAALCGGGAVICLVAWKAAQAPPMLWVGAAICIAGAIALYIGHERGLSTTAKPQPPPA